ncbi:MAG: hypothetical protein ACLQME_20975 [Alphaproteobacteria bacterium]
MPAHLAEIGDETRDCSMKHLPREVAFAKLGITVEGTKILGAERAGRGASPAPGVTRRLSPPP